MTEPTGLLPCTLDVLILKAASLGELHGYEVLLRIEQMSAGAEGGDGELEPVGGCDSAGARGDAAGDMT